VGALGLATATEKHTGNRPRTIYRITPAGRQALRKWLSDPPEASVFESEAMVKVFFADAGTIEQLVSTLDAIEANARSRIDDLRSMIDSSRDPAYEFATRLPINALALRFELDHQALQADWAAWARTQIASWTSTTDAGRWDWQAALP
jgi:hypothetical protein